MNPLLVLPVLEFGKTLLERIFPDAEQRAKAEYELLKMTQQGDLEVIIKQLEINAKEAEHQSIFVAGWRPFIGWGCGLAFLWATIGTNIASWLSIIYGYPEPPMIDTDSLLYVLGGLLGMGALRTYEKKTGLTK